MASSASQKTPKSERTRRRIIASYLALLDHMDFDKVPVSSICKEAQIVRSTFYVYFSDIYELIQLIEDEVLEALDHADDQTDEALEFNANRAKTDWGFPIPPPFSLSKWVLICEEQGLTLQAMLGPHGDQYFVQKLRKQLERHIRKTMNHDGMPRDKLREGFVPAMVDAHLALIRSWLLDEDSDLSPAMIVTILNTMRVGGSTVGHYATANRIPSWM